METEHADEIRAHSKQAAIALQAALANSCQLSLLPLAAASLHCLACVLSLSVVDPLSHCVLVAVYFAAYICISLMPNLLSHFAASPCCRFRRLTLVVQEFNQLQTENQKLKSEIHTLQEVCCLC